MNWFSVAIGLLQFGGAVEAFAKKNYNQAGLLFCFGIGSLLIGRMK